MLAQRGAIANQGDGAKARTEHGLKAQPQLYAGIRVEPQTVIRDGPNRPQPPSADVPDVHAGADRFSHRRITRSRAKHSAPRASNEGCPRQADGTIGSSLTSRMALAFIGVVRGSCVDSVRKERVL
jgi:hypothetical protein